MSSIGKEGLRRNVNGLQIEARVILRQPLISLTQHVADRGLHGFPDEPNQFLPIQYEGRKEAEMGISNDKTSDSTIYIMDFFLIERIEYMPDCEKRFNQVIKVSPEQPTMQNRELERKVG